MPGTSTDHWKKNPPKELLGNYGPTQQFKKAALSTTNTVIDEGLWAPLKMQKSTTGQVAGGLGDSKGFIVTTSSQKAAQAQRLDEDTLDAWNRSRQEVLQSTQRIKDLASRPYETEEPDHFVSTYQRSHRNFLPAVIPDHGELVFKDALPRGLYPQAISRERPTADEVDLDAVRTHGLAMRDRDDAMNDRAALEQQLALLKTQGVFLSRNGNTARADSQPLNLTLTKSTLTPHVQPLVTTTQAASELLEPEFYVDPDQVPRVDLTPEEGEFVQTRLQPRQYTDHFVTTHAEKFQDVSAEAEVDATYRKSHHFDKTQNTPMQPRLEPSRKANNLQNTQKTSDIVPGQYLTTNMVKNNYVMELLSS
eukprot:EG_transcript_11976